jgi:nitrate reductase gamma subunit
MEAFLNAVAPVALSIFVVGIGLRLGRWARAAFAPRRRSRGITRAFEGGAAPVSVAQALKQVFVNPVTRFHHKANPTWTRGYLIYHIAIVTKVFGYSLAALILLVRMVLGHHVPDVGTHAAASYNYEPANLLAIVFGNGEHLQAAYLFGPFAPAFITITWIAVICAVIGNMHLLITAIRRRNAAVIASLDPAARDIRTSGRMMWDRVAVRLVIFTIIWTELLARLEVVEGIVFVHAFLGLVLLMLLPFTYLFHMIYNVLAAWYAVRRRMARTIA